MIITRVAGLQPDPASIAAKLLHWLLALVLILPVVAIAVTAMGDSKGILWHLIQTRLGDYIFNTVVLMAGVGVLSLFFGVGTAWIISRYSFPFRPVLEWLLVLPAAVPAYLVLSLIHI